jgi:hypothetical protein
MKMANEAVNEQPMQTADTGNTGRQIVINAHRLRQ